MASKNVETARRAHEYFNARKMKECASEFAPNAVYHDHPRQKDWPQAQFVDFLEGWVHAFSDGQIADARYIDAGDMVVAEFRARGTNDGPIGSLGPTQKRIEMPYCEVFSFDAQGKIREVNAYYDLLTMFSQLGHLQRPREVELGTQPTP